MEIVAFNRKKGKAKLKIENEDDLWHLLNVLENSRVTMRTVRKIKKSFGTRVEVSKVKCSLTLRVDRVDYHPYLNSLRVGGPIVAGPEDISRNEHHTFSISPGCTLVVEKNFDPADITRLKMARHSQKRMVVLLLDRDEARFLSLRPFGIQTISEIHSHIPPKQRGGYDEAMKDFFEKILFNLTSLNFDGLVVAGPDNTKNNFADFCHQKQPSLKFTLETVSSATPAATKELLAGLLKKTGLGQEAALVEEIFRRIRTGKVAYGLQEVSRAATYGAIEALLITTDLISKTRRSGTYGEIESILRSAEKQKAKIQLINPQHEAGARLAGLGGIAATLRFEIG